MSWRLFPWTLCNACNATSPCGIFSAVAAPYYTTSKYTKSALSQKIGARSCTHKPSLFFFSFAPCVFAWNLVRHLQELFAHPRNKLEKHCERTTREWLSIVLRKRVCWHRVSIVVSFTASAVAKTYMCWVLNKPGWIEWFTKVGLRGVVWFFVERQFDDERYSLMDVSNLWW